MLPVLKRFVLILAICAASHDSIGRAVAQSPASIPPVEAGIASSVAGESVDPTAEELKTFGPRGEIIALARAEVLFILSGQNSCSAWFRAAEPNAAGKFQSLRFAIDSSGTSEIVKRPTQIAFSTFFQPYVASTRQNAGWGSTITLNANGAFFKENAPVRVAINSGDLGFVSSFKWLVVGNFRGASLDAQVVTILHELGHILDLLPVDSGFPAAPQLSMQNTELVMRHCGAQIRQGSKRAHLNIARTLPADTPLTARKELIYRGASTQ